MYSFFTFNPADAELAFRDDILITRRPMVICIYSVCGAYVIGFNDILAQEGVK